MPTPAPEPPTSDARRLGRSFPSDLEELLGTPKASQNQPSQTERSFQKSPHVAFHFGISHGMRVLELVLPLASWALDPREPPAAALAALTAAVGNDTQNDALTLAVKGWEEWKAAKEMASYYCRLKEGIPPSQQLLGINMNIYSYIYIYMIPNRPPLPVNSVDRVHRRSGPFPVLYT